MPMFNYGEPTTDKAKAPRTRSDKRSDSFSPPARHYERPPSPSGLSPNTQRSEYIPYYRPGRTPPFQRGARDLFATGIKVALLILVIVLIYATIHAVKAISNVKRLASTGAVLPVFITQGWIIGDRVNIRNSPCLYGEILGQVNSNHSLQITDKTANGWYQIRLDDGRKGFVFGAFLKPDKPGGFNIALSTGDNVRIRTSTNSSSRVIGSTYKGEKLLISGRTGDWYKILLPNGEEGYVNSSYVQKIY